jgi:hypothetical protein
MNVTGASYDYTYGYDAAGRFEKIKLTSNGSVIWQYAQIAFFRKKIVPKLAMMW